jgi:murein DD-endopeptidase MepM/ murein hydrolase activator NlpD
MSDPWSPPWRDWADQLDPGGLRYTPWQDYASDETYAYGSPFRGGMEYDPLPRGDTFTPYSATGYAQIDADLANWSQNWELTLPGKVGAAPNPGQVGNPTTPEWARVNEWNQEVLNAVQLVQETTGVYVPPNVAKAIMMIESQGVMPNSPNPSGAVGLMQVTGSTMGQYDLARANRDPAYSIWAGVNELALRYQDAQRVMGGAAGWDNAAVGYFSGHYTPTGADDYYGTTDQLYMDRFNQYMGILTQFPSCGPGTPARTGTQQLNAIWGGFAAPTTQEFGPNTAFAQTPQGRAMYGYTSEYTIGGVYGGHIGIDVGVSARTPLYTPVSGTVICGGTGHGMGQDACAAFGSTVGTARQGRFQVMLDNGDMLILGHMYDVAVQPGQRVNAGDYVGESGNQNGDHVHIEYRKSAPGQTNSGYLAVDPALALQGIFTGTYGQGPQPGTELPAGVVAAPSNWNQFMINAASGLPITGDLAPDAGGFHDWLQNAMGNIFADEGEGEPPNAWIFGYEAPPLDPVTGPPIG